MGTSQCCEMPNKTLAYPSVTTSLIDVFFRDFVLILVVFFWVSKMSSVLGETTLRLHLTLRPFQTPCEFWRYDWTPQILPIHRSRYDCKTREKSLVWRVPNLRACCFTFFPLSTILGEITHSVELNVYNMIPTNSKKHVRTLTCWWFQPL